MEASGQGTNPSSTPNNGSYQLDPMLISQLRAATAIEPPKPAGIGDLSQYFGQYSRYFWPIAGGVTVLTIVLVAIAKPSTPPPARPAAPTSPLVCMGECADRQVNSSYSSHAGYQAGQVGQMQGGGTAGAIEGLPQNPNAVLGILGKTTDFVNLKFQGETLTQIPPNARVVVLRRLASGDLWVEYPAQNLQGVLSEKQVLY